MKAEAREGAKGGENWELKGKTWVNIAAGALKASLHKRLHCYYKPNSWPNLWRGWKTHNKTFSSGPTSETSLKTTAMFDSFRIFPVCASFAAYYWSAAANWQHIQKASRCLSWSASEYLFWLESLKLNECLRGFAERRQGTACMCVCHWF